MNIMDDKIKELKRDLRSDIIDVEKTPSLENKVSEKNYFGKEIETALEIARKLEFKTKNIDGHMGYAEYGTGEECISVIEYLDVVSDKEVCKYNMYLYALKVIKESQIKLKRKVRVIFVMDDESIFKYIKYYLKKEKSPIVVYGERELGKFTIQNYLDIENIKIHQDLVIDKNIKYCCIEIPKEYIYEDIICYLENKANSEEGIISTYKNINIKVNEKYVIITSFMNSDIAKTGIYGNNVLINLVNYLVEENFIEHKKLSKYFSLINKYFYKKKELFINENSKEILRLELDKLDLKNEITTIEFEVKYVGENKVNYKSDESMTIDDIILNTKIFADIICELDKEE